MYAFTFDLISFWYSKERGEKLKHRMIYNFKDDKLITKAIEKAREENGGEVCAKTN